jgi:hypothetical protein
MIARIQVQAERPSRARQSSIDGNAKIGPQGGLMRPLPFGLAIITLCGLSGSLYGGVILSENFDELTQQLAATSVGAFSTINGTNVDIVGASFGLCAAPENDICIDMNGTNGDPAGQLESNMEFAAGTYLLSFDLIGSQRGSTDSTTVTFGNYDQEFTLASGDDSSGIVVNQLATLNSPGFLLFTSDQDGNIGNLLDNVVVSTPNSAVPEPSSALPLGLATLAGIFVLVRKSRTHFCEPPAQADK